MKRCSPGTPVADRIHRYLEWRGDCLEWTGTTSGNGYGLIDVGDRKFVVTRLVMEMIVGPVPSDLQVCHTCDNPPCCNPEHLFVGTRSDNLRDSYNKGRRPLTLRYGTANNKVRHDDELVAQACAEMLAGATQREVAARLGVAQSTVQRWAKGLTRARGSGRKLVKAGEPA